MTLGQRYQKIEIDQATKKRIYEALIAGGVRLPQGALLYEMNGKPHVWVEDQDLLVRLMMQRFGDRHGFNLYSEKPPLTMVQLWGLLNEPATQVINAIRSISKIKKVEMEYGASTNIVALNIYCDRGSLSDGLQLAVSRAINDVTGRNLGLVVFAGQVMESP